MKILSSIFHPFAIRETGRPARWPFSHAQPIPTDWAGRPDSQGLRNNTERAGRPDSQGLSITANRAGRPLSQASSQARRMGPLNRWREQYNPLRGLNIQRAWSLLEAYQRGEMADLEWTYFFVEGADPDLFALIERRTAAILDLDWNIKIMDFELPIAASSQASATNPLLSGGLEAKSRAVLAAEQSAALREAYDRIDNLYEAIEHLSMATFRGYSHLEKHSDAAGQINHLELLDQWNVVRDGLRGDWKYNPEAKSANYRSLPDALRLDPARWIIREVKRHVNRIGLVKYVRSATSHKDWDAFVEIYGIPGAIIIGPPNASPEEQAGYEAQADLLAQGANGYLPNGASVQFFTGPRLNSPYQEHLRYLTEQLVLAGTGGMLSMLTAPGSGTLAGNAHAKAFEQIARAEARQISEVFQRQLDAALLDAAFPGQPHLAYFDIAAHETTGVTAAVEQAVQLRQAGFAIDAAELSEKTGFHLSPEKTETNLNPQN